ncbi:MAG: hypothetical protein HY722_13330 [Planctomycetes bacterium]|nr:hypothetical protein [Planctomycetota bacterium]
MADDVAIDTMLERLGFGHPEARGPARAALEEAGLTHAGKQRIHRAKEVSCEETLRGRYAVSCGRSGCVAALAGDSRPRLPPSGPSDCEVCRGSDNRAATAELLQALAGRGVRKVVVVGGSPAAREEIQRLLAPAGLKLRLVDGTARRTGDQARGDLAWADLVVVWGGTELDHKVSTLYTDGRPRHVVSASRRGIAAVADAVLRHLAGGSARLPRGGRGA